VELNDLRRPNAIPPIVAGFVLASLPRSASAEVSDKVASMQDHWLFAIVLSTLAFALVRWRLWLLGPAAMLFLFVMSAEWESPGDDIGAAVLQEQGWLYFASLWCSCLLMMSGLVAGALVGWRRLPMVHARSTAPPQET